MIGLLATLWQPLTGLALMAAGALALRRALRPGSDSWPGQELARRLYDRLIWRARP